MPSSSSFLTKTPIRAIIISYYALGSLFTRLDYPIIIKSIRFLFKATPPYIMSWEINQDDLRSFSPSISPCCWKSISTLSLSKWKEVLIKLSIKGQQNRCCNKSYLDVAYILVCGSEDWGSSDSSWSGYSGCGLTIAWVHSDGSCCPIMYCFHISKSFIAKCYDLLFFARKISSARAISILNNV